MRTWALRALAGLGSGLIALALVIEACLVAGETVAGGAALGAGLWRYLGFFTVLTNLFVATVLARTAWRPAAHSRLNSASVELAALASILFVGLVYNLALAGQWTFHGARRFDEIVLHDVSPILFLAYWLLRPRGALHLRDALMAGLWPVAYALYGLLRGAFDGFYPYYFLDPSKASWPHLAFNLIVLCAAFVAMAALLVGLDRMLGRRLRRSSGG
jgi:hypothetical protein